MIKITDIYVTINVSLFHLIYIFCGKGWCRHGQVAGGERTRVHNCQVVEVPWRPALAWKGTQQQDRGPDNASTQRINQWGNIRDTEAWRNQWRDNPLGSDKDLGAGQGQKRGEAQGTGTSDGGWHEAGTGHVQVGGALHRDRRWGAGERKRGLWHWTATAGETVRRRREKNDPENGRNKRFSRPSLKV